MDAIKKGLREVSFAYKKGAEREVSSAYKKELFGHLYARVDRGCH